MYGQPISDALELRCRYGVAVTAGGHSDHQRDALAEATHDLRELFMVPWPLEEQHVHAGLDVALGALARALEPFDRDRIAAGDQHHIRVASRVQRRPELA